MPIELKDKFLKALVGEYARLKYSIDKKVGFKTKIYNSGGQYNLFDLDYSNNTINLINLFIELLSGRKIYYFRVVSKFTDVKKDYLFNSIEILRIKVIEKYNHVLGLISNVFKLLLLYSTEIEFKRGDKCI
ncbi:MAG: hypothetical protein AB8U93_02365 [Francisella endosymbiont of Hyalomma scupense]